MAQTYGSNRNLPGTEELWHEWEDADGDSAWLLPEFCKLCNSLCSGLWICENKRTKMIVDKLNNEATIKHRNT